MKVLIYGQRVKESDLSHITTLIDVLTEKKIDIWYHHLFLEEATGKIYIDTDKVIEKEEELLKQKIDVVITLGGDGTILKALTLINDRKIPILGINLGRLGFLANVEKSNIATAIDKLIEGSYKIEERTLLQLECNKPLFGEDPVALNDFTLHKRDTSSMITIHTYINDVFLNSYWADGVIVSTPTGSTGYSLSCGGPIVFPRSENFAITPVAPHNLNVRPIVIPDDAVIRFEIEGRSENFLATLDSRYETITAEHIITIRRAEYKLQLIDLGINSFHKTIHNKLMWGLDSRNQSI